MAAIKNRVSVVERLYFQNHIDKESPIDHGSKFSINLKSDEQPYLRDQKVGTEWSKVDFGWLISSPGLFELTNNDKVTSLELAYAETQPEGSQIALDTLKAVNSIYPTVSIRNALAANVELYVRSQAGVVKYSLVAFPK